MSSTTLIPPPPPPATEPSGDIIAGTAPAADPPTRTRRQRLWRGPEADPALARPALLALLAATAVLYLWGLGASGWANTYYSGAVQAATKSWKAFFFGSTDASNFITIDKTPLSIWPMAISARIFGVSSWSILVPQALEGVAVVAVLHATVKRWFGPGAALVAGAVAALTPAAVLMFRFNNPDALLVLLLVAAAWATTRALEDGRTRWLLLAGVFVGLGFLAKELQAFLVLPAIGLAYLVAGPPRLGRRIWQLFLLGVATVAAGGWWVAIVQLTPASARPYIGGSQNNSFWNVLFGYNGFGRLTGSETGSVGGGAGPGGQGGQWGPTGWTRLFNQAFGGQASWLIPAALILLAGGLIVTLRRGRTDRTRAALVLWGGWLLVTGIAISLGQGIIHEYYTVALVPAIGALVGIGGAALWRRRSTWFARAVLAAALLATTVWAYALLGRTSDWAPALAPMILVLGIATTCALLVPTRGRVALAVLGAALVVALAAPTAYAAVDGAHPAHRFPADGRPGGGRTRLRPRRGRRAPRRTGRCGRVPRRCDRQRQRHLRPTGLPRRRDQRWPRRGRRLPGRSVHRRPGRRRHGRPAERHVGLGPADHAPRAGERRLPLDRGGDRRQQRGELPARLGPGDHGDRRLQRQRSGPDGRAVPVLRPPPPHPLLPQRRRRVRWTRRRWLGHVERDLHMGRVALHRDHRGRRDGLRPLRADHVSGRTDRSRPARMTGRPAGYADEVIDPTEEPTMPETTAKATIDIRAPRAQVWRALTDPDEIRRYYLGGAEVRTDWQVGSAIVFRGEWNGETFEDKGEIVTFEPERELAYSHFSPMMGKPDAPENYHLVDITLDGGSDTTTVTLEQSNLTGGVSDEDRASREQFEQNWQQMLEGLRDTAEA